MREPYVMKKVLVGVAALVGVLVVVVVIGFLSLDPKRLVTEKKDALWKDLSAQLGRELTSGDISARVGTSLGATIRDVRLAGPASANGKAGAPQLAIAQVDVQFSLWRALLSFGRALHVEHFTVDGLVLRAARDAEGRWDFQDILDKRAGDAIAADDPAKAPADTSLLQGLRIASVTVRNARIELNDATLGRPLVVDALNIGSSDIVPGDPLSVWLMANLVDGGRTTPIDVRTKLAVLPRDFSFDPLPDLEVALKITDVDLGAWGGLVPVTAPGPVAGVVRTDLQATLSNNADVVDTRGTVMLRGLVLRDALSAAATPAERRAAPRGTPLDLDIAVDAHLDAKRTDVKKLTLQGSGVAVDAVVVAEGGGLSGLKRAAVQAKVADLQKLLGALPPSLRGLPPEVRIDGPLDASLNKDGGALAANVGLDGARVRYVGKDDAGVESTAFDKAAGKPLNLAVSGKDNGGALDIDTFRLVVDTIRIDGRLSLPAKDGAPLIADIHSGAVSLPALQGLVPPFKDAIGRGQKVDGTVSLDVSAKSVGDQQEAQVALALKSLDVNLASTIVRGQGGLTVKATPAGSDVTVVAAADLDGLSIQKTSSGTTTLNKPAGLPLRLDVDVKKSATAATINAVKLVIGKSSLVGRGTVSDLGKKGERLALDFGTVDVAFNDLRQALPGASKLPAGGRLKTTLALRGGLSATAKVVDAKNLDITFGSTRIAGSVGVDNLEAPRLDVNLPTLALAFEDVRPLLASPGDLPAGGRFSGSLTARGDTAKPSTMSVDVKIDALSMAKSDLKGTVKLANLDQPRFTIATQSDVLDVDALKAAFGGGSSSSSSSSSTVDENPHGLSKSARALLAGVSGKATLTAKRARMKDMTMSNFNGVLVVTRGVARFDTLTFGFYGGTVTASGTTLNLPAERTGYDLAFKAKDVDFGAFLADQSGVGRVFTGKVSPNLALKGKGIAAGDFASNAEGPAELAFSSLNIASLNLLEPLGGAVKKSGKGGAFNANAASTEGKQGLKLSGFTALTRLIGGKMRLEKPIETDTPLGRIKIEGGTSLANTLDFKTTLQLTPAMIGKLTGGKVKPKEAIPVPMKIGGSWDKPQVTGVDVNKLLLALVGDVAKDILDKGKEAVGGKVKDAVGDALGGLLGGNDKGKKKKRR